jgi:hypothetical protein
MRPDLGRLDPAAEILRVGSPLSSKRRAWRGRVGEGALRKIREYRMKIVRVAALIFLLTGPAYAQVPNINLIPEIPSKTPDEIEQEQARDKAYKESLKKIPDARVSDPWGGVRNADAPKSPAKTTAAKTKSKTGGNPN